ncbi:TetR/AcrR family transcriptional regulator [Nocardia vinacea]|uniref:TetR/AcrR family transcriptional regulator n=1 Tax=Nocardia vinacea TaxID=96468 RepID=UPI0002F25CFA|nr:TetR/AcrR family transcriptional regulator [Nocardia vinacea]
MASLTRTPGRDRAERDERRDAVEHRVLAAVDRLLADGTSYTELAVQRIATEADIARSTFYRYFPDKSRLLIRMAELATDDQFRTAERWWAANHADGEAGVIEAMRMMIDATEQHHRLLRALIEVSAYDSDVAAYWHARLRRFIDLVRNRLDTDRDAGYLPDQADTAATALALTCMVERSIDVYFATAPSLDPQQLARALGRIIWLSVSPQT